MYRNIRVSSVLTATKRQRRPDQEDFHASRKKHFGRPIMGAQFKVARQKIKMPFQACRQYCAHKLLHTHFLPSFSLRFV